MLIRLAYFPCAPPGATFLDDGQPVAEMGGSGLRRMIIVFTVAHEVSRTQVCWVCTHVIRKCVYCGKGVDIPWYGRLKTW